MDLVKMGGRIRSLRIEKGLTTVEMAEKIGMAQSNYSRIENGQAPNLPVTRIADIATVLGTTIDYLITGRGIVVKSPDIEDQLPDDLKKFYNDNKKDFWIELTRVMHDNQLTPKEVAQAIEMMYRLRENVEKERK